MVLLCMMLLGACVKIQNLSYRPPGSKAASWQVRVTRDGNTFMVHVDNALVIRQSPGLFESRLESSAKHRDHDVRLRVHTEFEVFKGNHWVAEVLIDNEQVGTADL